MEAKKHKKLLLTSTGHCRFGYATNKTFDYILFPRTCAWVTLDANFYVHTVHIER